MTESGTGALDALLADLLGTFAGWYRDGRPDELPVADLSRRFCPAIASFLSAVARHRGASLSPGALLDAPDMVERYDRAVDSVAGRRDRE